MWKIYNRRISLMLASVLAAVCLFSSASATVTILAPDFPAYQEEALKAFDNSVNIRLTMSTAISERLTQELADGTGNYDLYMLPLNKILEYEGLGATDVLQPEELLPFLREKLCRDGKVIGMPVLLECDTVGYSRTVAQQLGIENMPGSWEELLDFIGRFEELYGKAAQELGITLFPTDLYATQIALRQHLARRGADEEMMDRVFRLSWRAPATDTTLHFWSHGLNSHLSLGAAPSCLFTAQASLLPENSLLWAAEHLDMGDIEPMDLPLRKGEQPILPVSGQALVINPHSSDPEGVARALAFLRDENAMSKYIAADNLMLVSSLESQQPVTFIAWRILSNTVDPSESAMQKIKYIVSQKALDRYHQALERDQILWYD